MAANFDRVRQMFADQFEPDAQGFVYRKSMKGAPIPVSTAERDRYIATFNRFTRHASWGIMGGTIFLAVPIVLYAATAGFTLPQMALYLGLGAIFVAYMAAHFWIWNLPMRELRDRGTSGEARSRAEVKQLLLEKTTYGQIATIAGAGIVLLLKSQSNGGMLSGWNPFWAGLGAVGLVAECRSSTSKMALRVSAAMTSIGDAAISSVPTLRGLNLATNNSAVRLPFRAPDDAMSE